MAERTFLTPYRTVLAARMHAQRSYRASFRLDLVGALLVGLVELAEVWVLYRNVPTLGGLTLSQVILVFGIADLSFSLADMVAGHCDELPTYLHAGMLDVFYLRPQPLLAQLVTSDISLRRLARALVGIGALVAGLVLAGPGWSVSAVLLIAMAIVFGTLTFAAMFVLAAGLQFFLVNGAEMTNAFVYGGRYAATQPASLWSRPSRTSSAACTPRRAEPHRHVRWTRTAPAEYARSAATAIGPVGGAVATCDDGPAGGQKSIRSAALSTPT